MPSNRRADRRALSLLVAAGLAMPLAAASTALALPVAPEGLDLRTGYVETSRSAVPLAELAGARAAGKHFVIQLDGPMTPSRREALAAAGIEVGEYLPTNAFLARLEGATRESVAGLGFVRWVGEYQDGWKLEPEMGRRVYETPERQALALAGRERVLVYTFPGLDPNATERAIAGLPGARLLASNPVGGRWELLVEMPLSGVAALAGIPDVRWAEPEPETALRSNYNTRWILQSNLQPSGSVPASVAFPIHSRGIRGEGQVVGVIDSGVAAAHCSFQDAANPIGASHRKIVAYNGALAYGQHGTHVAGTAVGDPGPATADPSDVRGVAHNAKLAYGGAIGTASSETGFITQATFQMNAGARIHTNSWGNDGTRAYTANCRGIDRFVYENEDNLVLFAVSNGSQVTTPENAKNCLGVGATGPAGSQANFGSGGTGPTLQGSRRPEVWAPGQGTISSSGSSGCATASLTGTSMASPAVAGAAALVRQYFTEGWYPAGVSGGPSLVPSGALLRAMLVNSGQDMTGSAGYPGVRENWGRVLLDSVLFFQGDARKLYVKDVRNAQGLSTGGVDETIIPVLGSGEALRVTMSFHEPAAAENAANIFINNLDLEVESPTGQIYLGNVFNETAGASQTGGAADANDNSENVFVPNPTPGQWKVRVKGTAVNQGTQGFALVVTGDVTGGQLPPLIVGPVGTPPNLIAPNTPTALTARVVAGSQQIVPGSPALLYRSGPAASFITLPMTAVGNDQFTATLPGFACGSTPQWYFRAAGDGGTTVSSPANAPTTSYSAAIGTTTTTNIDVLNVDFGAALPAGWTATGLWNLGGACAPTGTACAGSTWAYYGQTTTCNFATGATTSGLLTAPPVTLPALPFGGSITLTYCSALLTENNPSYDKAEVLVNGTVVGRATESAGWTTETVNLNAYAGQTVTLAFRFDSVDSVSNTGRGWSIDNLRIGSSVTTTQCVGSTCYANCDGSTAAPTLNALDFSCFLNRYVAGDAYANCDGSTNAPVLNALDFGCFLGRYQQGCR